jgi:thiamine pyrophosphokinase
MNAKQIKSVLIIANGQPPKDPLLKSLIAQSDCIIAANGGSTLCYQRKVYPHFIVGDLDSARSKVLSHFKDAEIIRLADQNKHDLDKAIGFALALKPELIRVVAAFGKRLDHSLANLLLLQAQFNHAPLEFYDDYGKLSMIRGDTILQLPIGTTISLFSFLPVYGLSLSGFKYSVQSKDFPHGFNGLSNIISAKKAHISIKAGLLYIYTSDGIDTT